ncbi:MAG: hypothetical protein QF464_15065, partial [Myxococcota bacterium]|nr:hypothetical protein [Myxococcota bacterium]
MWASLTRATAFTAVLTLLGACSGGSDVAPTDAGIDVGFPTADGALFADSLVGVPSDTGRTNGGDGAPASDIHAGRGQDSSGGEPWPDGAVPVGGDGGAQTGEPDGTGPPPEPGCLDCGQPCDDGDECLSGWCVEGPDGDICTETCDAECPPGMSCRAVTSGPGDDTYICVPDHVFYCRPCSSHGECAPALLDTSPHRCVEHLNGAGSFCATTCDDSTDCPLGAVCNLVDSDGETLGLCQPAAGECVCTAASTSVEAATDCAVINGWGVCHGQRYCSETGLTECDGLDANTEVCNGLDDDCDGGTDEDFPEL